MKRYIRKIISLISISGLVLVGCSSVPKENNKDIVYIVSGVISDKSYMYNMSHEIYLVIETDDGAKVPIYEDYSCFSRGLNIGDKVEFEVKRRRNCGYEIIGINIPEKSK